MAAGGIYTTGVVSVAAGAYLSLQSAAGSEIVIHNIAASGQATIEYYDSVAAAYIPFDAQSGAYAWSALQLHCNHTVYYRVKNTGAVSINIGADGVYTLVA